MTITELVRELKRFNDTSLVLLKYQGSESYWGDLDSYRGYYCELAVSTGSVIKNVLDVIMELEAAIGATFTGYKGGENIMCDHTEIYWAEYGNLGPIASKVYYRHGEVIIECEADD